MTKASETPGSPLHIARGEFADASCVIGSDAFNAKDGFDQIANGVSLLKGVMERMTMARNRLEEWGKTNSMDVSGVLDVLAVQERRLQALQNILPSQDAVLDLEPVSANLREALQSLSKTFQTVVENS